MNGQILYRLHSNYSLPAPNSEAKEYYFTKIIEALYYSPEIVDDLLPSSMKGVDFEIISYDSKCNAASSILLESVLKNRSHKVGVLIRAANSIRKLKLNSFVSNVTLKIVSLIFMNQHTCICMITLIAN